MDSNAPAAPFSAHRSAPWIIELSMRILVGGYFIIPALQKLLQPPVLFAKAIEQYQLLAPPWSSLLALGLPWVELIAGLCLIFRRLYFGSLTIIGGMLAVFVFAVARAWQLNIDCGCFGSGGSKPYYGVHILLNLVMLACTGALVWLAWKAPAGSKR